MSDQSENEVLYEINQHVATITFNRAEKQNTISGPMLSRLSELMLKADADLKANEILAKAEAQAKVLRGEAEAASAKFFKEFEKNPELANFLFNLNAMEGSLKENSTLILDPNTPPFNLLTQPQQNKKN